MSRHRHHFDADFSDDDFGIEIEQQSDSDIAAPAVHTPPPPPKGLIISKLGVQATTGDETAAGLLCLKITLPRDCDRPDRWGLFSGDAPRPKLRSIPALYPLPISPALLEKKGSNLRTACQLLSLSSALAEPGNSLPSKPYIDVSATTGQVFVALDPAASNGTPRRRSSIGSKVGGRAEWLVVVEFEIPIEKGAENLFRTQIPVPRCLDSVIRFHVLPSEDDNMEVNIAIEPKVLPFSNPLGKNRMPPSPSKNGRHDQALWDDNLGLSDDDTDDGVGSWLEGRFQSTDSLFIEWALVPSVGSPPDLRVTPAWRQGRPTISVSFEATLPPTPGPLGVKAILPQDWGWQELEIRGDGLLGWRSSGESSGVLASAASPHANIDPDSTATMDDLHGLNGLSTPPPDHQVALADLEPDDFSFELSSIRTDARPRPVTPSLRRSITAELAQASMFKVKPRTPVHASSFELEFEADDEEEDRVIIVRGVLAPLPLTLVPPEKDMEIPFVHFVDPSLPTRVAVICDGATFHLAASEEAAGSEGKRLCEVWKPSIGTFSWGHEAAAKEDAAVVSGPVKVVAQRNIWGVQTIALAFQWPGEASGIKFDVPTKTARIIRATALGRQIARSITDRGDSVQIRLAGGRGVVEVVLEAVDAEGVALPSFPGGTGEIAVELVGPGWDRILNSEPKSNLTRIDAMTFTGSLSPAPRITFTPLHVVTNAPETRVIEKVVVAPPPKSRWKRLLSFTTLFNLFLLYVLVSLAQEVQKLRSEVQFIADEQRDLRLYSFERANSRAWVERTTNERWEESAVDPDQQSGRQEPPRNEADGRSEGLADATQGKASETAPESTPTKLNAKRQASSTGVHSVVSATNPNYGLGRVVVKRTSWKDWIEHPSVQKVATTLARLWHTLSWLLL